MKLIAAAVLALIIWQAYHPGYKNGLRSSPEYAAAISAAATLATDERLVRLERMLSAGPTKEQCVPVLAGEQIDEYSFCEDLLSDLRNREIEAQAEATEGQE